MALFPYKAAMQLSLLCASWTLFSSEPLTHEARFLKRMKEYWKEGDFATAKRQIRAYLEQNEQSNLSEEMHLLLGDLYLKEGNFLSALSEYAAIEKQELQDKIFYNKILCFYETSNVQELANASAMFTLQSQLTLEQKNSVRYLCASGLFEYIIKAENKDPAILERTKELFESCSGTSFEQLSLYPLARIFEMEGNKKTAASYYEAASKAHPDLKIEFLFQASILRAEVAPELAIANLEEIFSIPSSRQTEALYNLFILQYKTKQFKELAASYKKNHHLLSETHAPGSLEFFAKSLYHTGEFQEAIVPLSQALENSKTSANQRTLQLMLLECAHKTGDVELYHKMFRHPSYPLINDENYSKAHLVYLNLLKTKERYPEFVEESKVFVQQNQDSSERSQILWDSAYFQYQSKNWKDAAALLSSFIQDYPSNKSISNAWRLQLNCSLFQVQTSPASELSANRAALITKIQEALKVPDVLSAQEKETFSFELAKNLFLENRFAEAQSVSEELLAQASDTRLSEELELLQTLCYLNIPESQSRFITQAEKLLDKSPNFPEADKLRLHLFNAYAQSAAEADAEEKELPLHQAARHLYAVFERNILPLKEENIQWLAEHYYALSEKLQKDALPPTSLKELYLTRSIAAFERLLPTEDFSLQESTEVVLLRLSSLFTWSGQTEKKIATLSRYIKEVSPSQGPMQRQLILELAQSHQQIGDSLQALDLYNQLIQNHPFSSTRAIAILERSQLLSSFLPEDQQTEENATYAQNLSDLKDLEVQRSLLSEPLHLEAGLEYIRWKSSLAVEGQNPKEKQIQLLKLFQENFQTEFVTEENADATTQAQEKVLSAYLKFAEAEMLRLQATLAEVPEEAQTLQANSQEKIRELLAETSLPKTLQTRIEISQKEWGQAL